MKYCAVDMPSRAKPGFLTDKPWLGSNRLWDTSALGTKNSCCVN